MGLAGLSQLLVSISAHYWLYVYARKRSSGLYFGMCLNVDKYCILHKVNQEALYATHLVHINKCTLFSGKQQYKAIVGSDKYE